MPANLGGSDVRRFPAPKEDETHEDHSDVVPKVEMQILGKDHRFGESLCCTKFRTAHRMQWSSFLLKDQEETTYFKACSGIPSVKYVGPPTSTQDQGRSTLFSSVKILLHYYRLVNWAGKLQSCFLTCVGIETMGCERTWGARYIAR